MERSTDCTGDCEMEDRKEEELELGKPSVGPTERKRSSCDSAESHHAPLVGASSLQPTTDSVALEAINRRIKRMKTLAGNSFGSSSDEIDSSAGGSLQTEGNRNAAVAASLGRPPRYPIVGPPPAQRAANSDRTPYAYTKSPNGRRVYGFLYRYSAGDSKIMCACHGEFFTPAQFVEHGGGGVVENPDQHIIVTPFPFAS